jgi:probable HAF family extracellular repeat protein
LVASSISASGQVVGTVTLPDTSRFAYATTSGGNVTQARLLGTSVAHGSSGVGINSLGQVVGSLLIGGGPAYHAYRTAPDGDITAANDLGTLGGQGSFGNAINDAGQVVGNSQTSGGETHAFRTTPGGTVTAATDLGTLGGTYSDAVGINAAGQVVGSSTFLPGNSARHAYRTAPGGAITPESDLGTLGGTVSSAYAVNALGQAVGTSFVASGDMHAFFVDVTGQMQDLNELIPPDSGWVLQLADGVNDAGQISGYGYYAPASATRAFLLTPVPEPASLSPLLVLCASLTRRRRGPRA